MNFLLGLAMGIFMSWLMFGSWNDSGMWVLIALFLGPYSAIMAALDAGPSSVKSTAVGSAAAFGAGYYAGKKMDI